MIVEYFPNGQIFHLVNDPVEQSIVDFYAEDTTKLTINIPPTPWPPTQDVDPDTGELVFEKTTEENPEDPANPIVVVTDIPVMSSKGVDYATVNPVTDYVSEGMIKARPEFNVPDLHEANVGDSLEIKNLPEGTTIRMEGEFHELTDNELVLEFGQAEEYEILFFCWPYADKIMKVKINEV